MTEEILINVTPQETRVAVVQQGVVQEVQVERGSARGLVGNVCMGRVVRVLPGMQSAFIDIGLERAAFLHVADVWHKPAEGETLSAASITYESMGRPHTSCSTLGTSDFMRVPKPAARMTTASGGRFVSAVFICSPWG